MNMFRNPALLLTSLVVLLLLVLAPVALAQGPYTITIGEIDAGAALKVNGSAATQGSTFPFSEGTTVTFTTTFEGETYEDVIELHYDIEVKVHAKTYATLPSVPVNLDTDLSYTPYDIFIITTTDDDPEAGVTFEMTTPPTDAPVKIIGFHAMVPEVTIGQLGSTSHSGTPAEFAEIFYGTVESSHLLRVNTTCNSSMGSTFNKIVAKNVRFGTGCGSDIDIMVQELYADYARSEDTEISWWRMELTDQFYVDDYDGLSLNDELPEKASLDADGMLWFKARNPTKWALYPLIKADRQDDYAWEFDNYIRGDYNFWETRLGGDFYWYNVDDYVRHYID
jgi:hypothetical protein